MTTRPIPPACAMMTPLNAFAPPKTLRLTKTEPRLPAMMPSVVLRPMIDPPISDLSNCWVTVNDALSRLPWIFRLPTDPFTTETLSVAPVAVPCAPIEPAVSFAIELTTGAFTVNLPRSPPMVTAPRLIAARTSPTLTRPSPPRPRARTVTLRSVVAKAGPESEICCNCWPAPHGTRSIAMHDAFSTPTTPHRRTDDHPARKPCSPLAAITSG